LLIKVEHPDVDLALGTRYVDQGELAAIALEPLDDLTGNAETHCLLHPLSDVVWIIDQLTDKSAYGVRGRRYRVLHRGCQPDSFG